MGEVDALAIAVAVALVGGGLALALRLPPLVGFVAAGFALSALGAPAVPGLSVISTLGVTLLLFGLGLKVEIHQFLRREVWVVSIVHLAGSVVIGTGLLALVKLLGLEPVASASWPVLWLVGFAVSFSSTVFVVKLLETRNDTQAVYGSMCIGVLIVQDLAAIAFLSLSGDREISPWVLTLLATPAVAWVLRRVWDALHHELSWLFGVGVALVPGYAWWHGVGLSGELGAFILGVLLASHPHATELTRTLFSVKELLLVGFFLSVGSLGIPSWGQLLVGTLLVLVLPLQGVLYVALMHLMRFRARTSVLAGAAMSNNSEFGLIVMSFGAAAGLLEDSWLATMSVAVAVGFVASTLINANPRWLVQRFASRLRQRPDDALNPRDRPITTGDAEAIVLGMGRVGSAVCRRLELSYGLQVLGVEHDEARVERLRAKGLRVVEGDATDEGFWARLATPSRVHLVVLAMPFHGANMAALELVREVGFTGTIAAVARDDDDLHALEQAGVTTVLHIYTGSGTALADSIADDLRLERRPT